MRQAGIYVIETQIVDIRTKIRNLWHRKCNLHLETCSLSLIHTKLMEDIEIYEIDIKIPIDFV